MSRIVMVAMLLVVTSNWSFAQCPFTANLTSTGECPGATMSVVGATTVGTSAGSPKNIAKIVWTRDGVTLGTASATASYNPMGVTVAGGNGAGLGANQLDHPQGIYVDLAGNVIVADENNNRIQAWPVGSSFGTTLASSYGAGSDPLVYPIDVCFDGYNDLYITDNTKNRIEKWVEQATVGVSVAGGNGAGSGANQLNNPGGIFLDLNGDLYIADITNQRVQKWASGATAGVTVAGGNGLGTAANQFQSPTAVFVDAGGNIYVVDNGNHRVQKWAPGAGSGITVAGGNGPGAGANQLDYPFGLYVDGTGNVFVADAGNNRIQEWAPGATAGVTVAGGNGVGSGANQFNDPRFVWMDGNGNLYVSDDLNARVQEFTLQTTINSNFTAPSPGVYTADVTFSNGCTAPSNPITIQGSGTPSIAIIASANPVNLCTNVSFAASYAGAGTTPILQWKVNNQNAGTGQTIFSSGSLHNGDVVTCIVKSTDACISSAPVTSNPITIGVNGLPEATMISKNVFCPGDTLAITSPDSLTQIVWSANGASVSTAEALPIGSAITVAGGNGAGSANNQLNSPAGVALDGQGNVYVADMNNNRVMKWAPGAGSGTQVSYVELEFPIFVTANAVGDVFVSDNLGATVLEFVPGSPLDVSAAGGHGVGSNANQLDAPGSVCLDAAGNVYVADDWNYRVQKWAPGAASGVTVAGGHMIGPDNDQVEPGPIFVDGAGNLWVFDAGYNRLMEWAPGATSGVQILGPADINFAPGGIWVDGAGNIYLTDGVDNSVKKFAPGSKVGVTVAGGNGAGPGANQLDGPTSLFLDAKGDIYVSDSRNHRVQEFLPHTTIDAIYQASTPGTYTAAVTTSGGCVLTTNTMIVKPAVTPGVSVNAPVTEVCSNTPVSLTATPTNGGTSPVYSWLVNGVDAGVNQPVFSPTLTTGVSTIVCQMKTNADCALQPGASSNPITITIDAAVTPAILINTASTTICSGAPADFVAIPANGGASPQYQWMVNGVNAGANSPDFDSSGLTNGDVVTCELTGDATCATTPTALSNRIPMQVRTVVAPTVDVTASPNPVCSGSPVTFSSAITNGGATPAYSWLINGAAAGGNGPLFTTSGLANGDVVSCKLSTGDVCAVAVSNSVVMQVYPTPVIAPNQAFTSTQTGVVLNPVITGDIVQYNWSPSSGLSATDIANPTADPAHSTVYTLVVVSGEGCTASGEIAVNVYSDIRLPSAFSPNGDGKNDKFYVLGGPQGSMIKDLAVFDRWGTAVFQVHDVPPGDPTYGWDGNYRGGPATTGTYVYALVVSLAGGKQQVFKGVVILLR
ncbi:MAG TPA: gliding motility-associated C-terminal domain-containing protein [Puia sp.]|nr:gliding motility-associated C-terminal domain-containing protein [Puia sp.]